MIRGRLWGRREVSFSSFYLGKEEYVNGWKGGRKNE